MKKVIGLLLTLTMVISSFAAFTLTASAQDSIKVVIDGKPQTYDVMPEIIDGRTLVPMRAIFESLGASVEWEERTKTVTGTKNTTIVKLQIGKTSAKLNNDVITLDVAPQILEGRTMVPVRFIAESLGAVVNWDGDTRTVIIESPVEAAVEKDTLLPDGGNIIMTNNDVYSDFTSFSKDVGVISKVDADKSLNVDIIKVVENQAGVALRAKNYVNSALFSEGDVCLIKLKAKLNSGGDAEGKGHIKVYFQNPAKSSEKAIFAEAVFGSEWTNLYFPYTAKANCNEFGIRVGAHIANYDIKEITVYNYGTSLKMEELPSSILGAAASTPSGSTPSATTSTKTDASDAKIEDAKLPSNGTVVLSWDEFIADYTTVSKNSATTELKDKVISVTESKYAVGTNGIALSFKPTIDASLAKAGDTMMLTFKARLLSGGLDGKGYLKPQFQVPVTYKKALFKATSFTNEWTTCYLPFTQVEGANSLAVRFNLCVQDFEIKDLQLINYGTSVKVEELPSTICDDPAVK